MVFVGKLKCDLKDAKKIAQLYTKFEKLPPDFKRRGPYFDVTDNKEVTALVIYRITSDIEEEEVSDLLNRRYKGFDSIPSVSYSIKKWLTPKESLELLHSL